MGKLLYPDVHVASVYDIDLQKLYNMGITNLIIDIDNTLSRWGSKEPEPNVCEWIQGLKNRGFDVCILSNSSNKRIERYCSKLSVVYVKNVHKPLKYSFLSAMKILGSNNKNSCVIGDQIFTDILGGNSCALYTILVSPIDRNEFILTRIMRKLESVILKKL